jgi:hypothetical protein
MKPRTKAPNPKTKGTAGKAGSMKVKHPKKGMAEKGTSGSMKVSAGKSMLARKEASNKATKQQKGAGK